MAKEQKEQQKKEDVKQKEPDVVKVVLHTNVKYKGKRYKIGETVEIDAKDKGVFSKLGYVKE